MNNYNKLETDLKASICSIKKSRSFTIELLLTYNASYYAVLGAKYIPIIGDECLHIEVRYLNTNTEKYEDTLAYNKKTVFKGLLKEYVDSVLNTSVDYLKYNTPPGGKIVFDVAACCKIGSSSLLFKIITKIVLQILINEQYPVSDEVIKNICEKYLKERFVFS
jgi:hypothetical protein